MLNGRRFTIFGAWCQGEDVPKVLFRILISFTFLASFLVLPAAAQQAIGFDTKAPQAFLVEDSTGTVLFSKNADAVFPPASLQKLATAEYVFNELKSGNVSEDTLYKVSEYAWRTGGALSRTSTMFAALNSEIRVIDLLRGVIVHLANDACIILAEGLAGSEDAFAEKLNERARSLGLTKSFFANSNGLPNEKNKTTAREMVFLARHIRSAYPDYFRLYAEEQFEWNKINQRNKNKLVFENNGIDGFATGFAEGHGFSVVATAERNGVRLYLALAGLKTDKERMEETRRVFDWAFNNFKRHKVFRKDEIVAEAPVFGGDVSRVPLKPETDVDIYIPVDNPDRIRARIAYTWPLRAPITTGQKVGMMSVSVGEKQVLEVPVYATMDVGTGTLTSKAFDGLKELLFFWL